MMKRYDGIGLAAQGLVCLCALSLSAYGQTGKLLVEAGTEATVGKFEYADATVDISEEAFNPRLSAEYELPKSAFSFGVAYASSDNDYSLEFDDGEKTLDGDLTVERTDLIPFIRLGHRDGVNFRIGYRMFEYELSDGTLDETEDGRFTMRIRNGTAKGELDNGIDAQLNLLFGNSVQFGVRLGATYFMDAEYTWQYRDQLKGGAIQTGTAKLDAMSVSVAPELTFRLADEFRLFVNYTIAGTTWIDNEDTDEDYAGTDVMTSLGVGLRATFGG